jgi:two-component system cell cycle response regulator
MSLLSTNKCTGSAGARAGASAGNDATNEIVICINRRKGARKESLESLLSSALRAEDTELDQVLSTIEEIANGLKSRGLSARSLEYSLQRVASYALKQSLLDRAVRSLAVTDELTGLYNRRGFLVSATNQLKLAHRNAQNLVLLFCDVNNLKWINDSFGHPEGDLALVRAADALEETFRDSDILARLGGDEFTVLASGAAIPNNEAIVSRIEENLEKANGEETRYELTFSVGAARFDPEAPRSLSELMALADRDMYVQKRYRARAASSERL